MATKKTSALAKLRVLIREEVKNAIREEMPVLIMEALVKQNRLLESKSKQGINPQDKKFIQEKKQKLTNIPGPVNIPGTLNESPFNPAQQYKQTFIGKSNSPINQLLAETANNMMEDDNFAFASPEVEMDSMSFMQNIDAPVGSIDGMLASSRASSALELVQVNQVPDFTGLMQKMLAKGIM
jgi:hypothetical protein